MIILSGKHASFYAVENVVEQEVVCKVPTHMKMLFNGLTRLHDELQYVVIVGRAIVLLPSLGGGKICIRLNCFIASHCIWLFTLLAVSMTTSMLRFCAAMASNSSSSSPTSQASLVMLSNSWKVVAFLGLPGVAGGGLLPALIRLEDKDRAMKTEKIRGRG